MVKPTIHSAGPPSPRPTPVWRPAERHRDTLVRVGGVVNEPEPPPLGHLSNPYTIAIVPWSEDSLRNPHNRDWAVVRHIPEIKPPKLPQPIVVTDNPAVMTRGTVLIRGSWDTCCAYYRCIVEYPHGKPEPIQQAGCAMCKIHHDSTLPDGLVGSHVCCCQCLTKYEIVAVHGRSGAGLMPLYRSNLVQRFHHVATFDKPEFIRWMLAHTLAFEASNGYGVLSDNTRLAQLYAAVMIFYSPFPGGRHDNFRESVRSELEKLTPYTYSDAFDIYRRRIRNGFVAHLGTIDDDDQDRFDGVALQPPPLIHWWGISCGMKAHQPLTRGHLDAFINLVEVTMLAWFYKSENVPPESQVFPLDDSFKPGRIDELFKDIPSSKLK